jgi:hypothetical protein
MLTSGLVQVSAYPAVRTAIVPAAQALPGVFTRIVNLLGH